VTSGARRTYDKGSRANLDAAPEGHLIMGKGMDRKKETKKKPAKSLLEKRQAKQEKRSAR
jgi:hypothetical protein